MKTVHDIRTQKSDPTVDSCTWCIKGNEHADRLEKQGAIMEQEKLPITLKQKKKFRTGLEQRRYQMATTHWI